jgi:hypothetical protein
MKMIFLLLMILSPLNAVAGPDDPYVPPERYEFRSDTKQQSFTVEHDITSRFISFMAEFDLGGTNGHTSRICVFNQKTLTFSFDAPFILDVVVWECDNPDLIFDDTDIRTIFGDGI